MFSNKKIWYSIGSIVIFATLGLLSVAAKSNWDVFRFAQLNPPVALSLVDNTHETNHGNIWIFSRTEDPQTPYLMQFYSVAAGTDSPAAIQQATGHLVNDIIEINHDQLANVVNALPNRLLVGNEFWNAQQVLDYLNSASAQDAAFVQAKIIQAMLVSYALENGNPQLTGQNNLENLIIKTLQSLPIGAVHIEMGN